MSWHVSQLQLQATWRPPSHVPGRYAQLYGSHDEDEDEEGEEEEEQVTYGSQSSNAVMERG